MGYRDPAYIVFDGDEDQWAYQYMRGWKQNENIDFDFRDAHDLDNMTNRAQGEAYVKAKLRERMKQSGVVIVLIGAKTKNLYKFVRWELELAIELGLPIIAVNLNNEWAQDADLCPAIIRDTCVVHIPFKLKAIRYTLDNWPSEYARLSGPERAGGARHYGPDQYKRMGLD